MIRRILGFTILPLLGALSPLIVLPVISRLGGSLVWQALGVGQAVGAIGSVVVLWGWWSVGPARYVNTATKQAKVRLYVQSVQQRVAVLLFISPALIVIPIILTTGHTAGLAVLMAFGAATVGLVPTWYAIGEGKPSTLAISVSLPNACAVLLSAGIILATHQFWVFPTLLILANVIPPIVMAHTISRYPWRHLDSPGQLMRELGEQFPVTASNIASQAYAGAPIIVASAVLTPLAASHVVSADRLYRMGIFTIASLGNSLQAWTLEPGTHAWHRHRRAIWAHLILGVLGGIAVATLMPLASRILFGEAVASPLSVSIGYGIAYFFVSVASPLIRNLLLPAGEARLVLYATLLAAAIGVPSMIFLCATVGDAGVSIGLAVGEGILALIVALCTIRLVRTKTSQSNDQTQRSEDA